MVASVEPLVVAETVETVVRGTIAVAVAVAVVVETSPVSEVGVGVVVSILLQRLPSEGVPNTME